MSEHIPVEAHNQASPPGDTPQNDDTHVGAHGRAPHDHASLPNDTPLPTNTPTPQNHKEANRRAPMQIQQLVHWLSARPTLWNLFRRILEFNFIQERHVINRELMPSATRIKQEGRAPVILDLGCGTGELAPNFLRAGYTYIGIDIEPERIQYASKTYRKGKFHVMDATHLVYADGYFDQILITGVLHHLSDEEVRLIIAEMKRVLRPEGRALVMEDIALRGSLNLLGALVHLADAGAYIRRPTQYTPLFYPHFTLKATYPVRCGVCDYQAFVLEPATSEE